jgi:adenylate cyclase
MGSMGAMDIDAVVRWLVDGCPGARGSKAVVQKLGDDLRALGVPLDRMVAFVRTLHPFVVGRSFIWHSSKPVEVRDNTYEFLRSPEFLESPVGEVVRTGAWVRRRLDIEVERSGGSELLRGLAAEGLTEYVAAPLVFLSGQVHALTFATTRPGGFDDDHVEVLRAIVPALSRIAEILALSRTAANLLDTYVGHGAGERILAGKIQRGDVDDIRAVIWFSDMRGFTSLSQVLTPNELIDALNELFEVQVDAIHAGGGEVLKFMGDGLLAIFPIVEGGPSVAALCDRALAVVDDALGGLARLNERRARRDARALHIGVALHVGDVAYGNIGGAGRLDFTCIGPAVNLAARLEGVASKVGRTLVVSDEFRAHASRAMTALGEFELKGVEGAQRVFAPA